MRDSVWAVTGSVLAAFAIWITVRIINGFRSQKALADLLTFRMLLFWTGVMGAAAGYSFDSYPTERELAEPVVSSNASFVETFFAYAAVVGSNLKGTATGTGIGLLFGWLISRRDVSLPTDDSGRR